MATRIERARALAASALIAAYYAIGAARGGVSRLLSTHAGRRRLKAQARERRLPVLAHEKIDERPRESRLPGRFYDGRRIRHRPIGVLRRPKRFDDLSRADRHVRRVDEAGLDLAAGNVIERLDRKSVV